MPVLQSGVAVIANRARSRIVLDETHVFQFGECRVVKVSRRSFLVCRVASGEGGRKVVEHGALFGRTGEEREDEPAVPIRERGQEFVRPLRTE